MVNSLILDGQLDHRDPELTIEPPCADHCLYLKIDKDHMCDRYHLMILEIVINFNALD